MSGETGRFIQLIWVFGKGEYFYGRDWTGQIALIVFVNFDFWRRSVARMSNAICGVFRPGDRCAHPGYDSDVRDRRR